jgi:hypothetical protein
VNANLLRVPVPAETGVEDRLVGSLTFRHAAYLAAGAAGVSVMVLGDPSVVRVVVGALLALLGFAGAACRPYGEPLDRLVPASVAYALRRRRDRRAAPSSSDEPDVPEPQPEVPDMPEVCQAEASQAGEPAPRPNRTRHPLVMRRVAAGLAVLAVLGVAVARLAERPAPPPPERQVVIVPVPVPAPDPWEEVDDALDTWFDGVVIG